MLHEAIYALKNPVVLQGQHDGNKVEAEVRTVLIVNLGFWVDGNEY